MSASAATGTQDAQNAISHDNGVANEVGSKLHNTVETAGAKAEDLQRAKNVANEMAAQGHSKEEIREELEQMSGLSLQGAVITVVVAGATAYAGINVMSSIWDTMSLAEGDAFYNSSTALQDGINSFFTNLPTVFVVIALVLIIGYLTLLR